MTVALSSSAGVAIRYVLPVLWMTLSLCGIDMHRGIRGMSIPFDIWRVIYCRPTPLPNLNVSYNSSSRSSNRSSGSSAKFGGLMFARCYAQFTPPARHDETVLCVSCQTVWIESAQSTDKCVLRRSASGGRTGSACAALHTPTITITALSVSTKLQTSGPACRPTGYFQYANS